MNTYKDSLGRRIPVCPQHGNKPCFDDFASYYDLHLRITNRPLYDAYYSVLKVVGAEFRAEKERLLGGEVLP